MTLEGRKILFFSPKAFGYEVAIKNRLEEMGACVVFYDERPSNSFWGKAMLRVSKRSMTVKIDTYYKDIYKELEIILSFDYIFLLNLEAMPVWFLKKIRSKYQNSPVTLYMWDSFRNKPHTQEYIPYCDRVITFDPADKVSDPKIEFRPLFFMNEYAKISSLKKYQYDISFIGTAHSDRFTIANKVKEYANGYELKTYFYFFLQSKKLYFYQKFTNNNFKGTKVDDFKYKPLSSKEVMDIIANSRVVLDVQHPKQTGLTMRTIEMLGAERKLITTNPAVKEYDFYNPQNILIIDRENPHIDKDFLVSPYQPTNDELYQKYSLDGWLEYILGNMI